MMITLVARAKWFADLGFLMPGYTMVGQIQKNTLIFRKESQIMEKEQKNGNGYRPYEPNIYSTSPQSTRFRPVFCFVLRPKWCSLR